MKKKKRSVKDIISNKKPLKKANVKALLGKKMLVGGNIEDIGTIAWTGDVVKEADKFFDLIGDKNITGEDYVQHIYETLQALGYEGATYKIAQEYYTDWLLSNEADESRQGKNGGRYALGGKAKKGGLDESDPLYIELKNKINVGISNWGTISVRATGRHGDVDYDFHKVDIYEGGKKTGYLYSANTSFEGMLSEDDVEKNVFTGDLQQTLEYITNIEGVHRTDTPSYPSFEPQEQKPGLKIVGKVDLSEFDKRKRHARGGQVEAEANISVGELSSGFLKNKSSVDKIYEVIIGRYNVKLSNGDVYRSLGSIKSSTLKKGDIVIASYNASNQGADIYEFLGVTGSDKNTEEAGNIKYESVRECLDDNKVSSLPELEKKQTKGHSYLVVVMDLETGETGAWFYVYEGRWSRGSGAEPLSFVKMEKIDGVSMATGGGKSEREISLDDLKRFEEKQEIKAKQERRQIINWLKKHPEFPAYYMAHDFPTEETLERAKKTMGLSSDSMATGGGVESETGFSDMIDKEYQEKLMSVINQKGYDDERKKIAIKAVDLLVRAKAIKLMSGAKSADKHFRQSGDFEQKNNFHDAYEIISDAEYSMETGGGVSTKKLNWRLAEDLLGRKYYYGFNNGKIYSTEESNITSDLKVKDLELVFPIGREHFISDNDRMHFIKEMIRIFPELSRVDLIEAIHYDSMAERKDFGGSLSKYWGKAKEATKSAYEKAKPHVKSGYEKTKELGKKGVEETKKAYGKAKKSVKDKIHEEKRKIALEVIDETKDKVSDSKYRNVLRGAEEIVETEYKNGGKITKAKIDSRLDDKQFILVAQRALRKILNISGDWGAWMENFGLKTSSDVSNYFDKSYKGKAKETYLEWLEQFSGGDDEKLGKKQVNALYKQIIEDMERDMESRDRDKARAMDTAKVGDKVFVKPDNKIGKIKKIDGDSFTIKFPDDGEEVFGIDRLIHFDNFYAKGGMAKGGKYAAGVLLAPKDKGSKSNWKRMFDAERTLKYQDGNLKSGKGWNILDWDATRISDSLTQSGIAHEKVTDYKIEIE